MYSICNIIRWFSIDSPKRSSDNWSRPLLPPYPLPLPNHQHPSSAPLAPDPIQNTVQNLAHILTLPSKSPLPNTAILAPERRNVLELYPTWPLVHPNVSALIPNSVRTFPKGPTHADYFTIAFKCFSVCFLFSVCNSVIDFPLPLHSLLESWQTYSWIHQCCACATCSALVLCTTDPQVPLASRHRTGSFSPSLAFATVDLKLSAARTLVEKLHAQP